MERAFNVLHAAFSPHRFNFRQQINLGHLNSFPPTYPYPLLSRLTHQPIPTPSLLLPDHPPPGCPPCCFSRQALQHYSQGPSSIAATHSHCIKSPKHFQTRTIVFCPVLLKTSAFFFFFVTDICKISITWTTGSSYIGPAMWTGPDVQKSVSFSEPLLL